MGKVFTFYSYKGGTGRSMALANVATALAEAGKKVLVIDWDLEAPGLPRYLESGSSLDVVVPRADRPGLVDLVCAFSEGRQMNWRDCVTTLRPAQGSFSIDLIAAGNEAREYYEQMQSLDWPRLFSTELNFGRFLEEMRESWKGAYDFVLIDSRTGVTDIGGICTIHLPDVLITLIAPNDQSIDGTANILKKVRANHQKLPFDRERLLVIPIMARDDGRAERELSLEWRRKIAIRFDEFFKDWIPNSVDSLEVLGRMKLPYVSFWSYGERLAVASKGRKDPDGLGFSYDTLAHFLLADCNWREAMGASVALPAPKKQTPTLLDQLWRRKHILLESFVVAAFLVLSGFYMAQTNAKNAEQLACVRIQMELKQVRDSLRVAQRDLDAEKNRAANLEQKVAQNKTTLPAPSPSMTPMFKGNLLFTYMGGGLKTNGLDFSGSLLRLARMESGDFSGIILRDADMTAAKLRASRFVRADASGANMGGADLTRTVWTGARLIGAKFWKADLTGADFTNADLSKTILTYAKMDAAIVTGVNLSGAKLYATDLRNTIGLTVEQICSTAVWGNARLPNDLWGDGDEIKSAGPLRAAARNRCRSREGLK
jgi:uncharacterized protein YjbI with pentapeptide repeats/cellulose biosynthesis protein BcsQ